MCACSYVPVHEYMFTCVNVCVCDVPVCIHAHMCVCVCVYRVYVYVPLFSCMVCLLISMRESVHIVYICVYSFTCVSGYVLMFACMSVCGTFMFTCVNVVCVHVHICEYVYECMHAHM